MSPPLQSQYKTVASLPQSFVVPPLQSIFLLPYPWPPGNLSVCFLFCNFAFSSMSYKCNHVAWHLLCLIFSFSMKYFRLIWKGFKFKSRNSRWFCAGSFTVILWEALISSELHFIEEELRCNKCIVWSEMLLINHWNSVLGETSLSQFSLTSLCWEIGSLRKHLNNHIKYSLFWIHLSNDMRSNIWKFFGFSSGLQAGYFQAFPQIKKHLLRDRWYNKIFHKCMFTNVLLNILDYHL